MAGRLLFGVLVAGVLAILVTFALTSRADERQGARGEDSWRDPYAERRYSDSLEMAARNAQAAEADTPARELVGQCAYNRSDKRLLGRVLSLGQKGAHTREGLAWSMQRAMVVRLTDSIRRELGTTRDTFTYPRNVVVGPCTT